MIVFIEIYQIFLDGFNWLDEIGVRREDRCGIGKVKSLPMPRIWTRALKILYRVGTETDSCGSRDFAGNRSVISFLHLQRSPYLQINLSQYIRNSIEAVGMLLLTSFGIPPDLADFLPFRFLVGSVNFDYLIDRTISDKVIAVQIFAKLHFKPCK